MCDPLAQLHLRLRQFLSNHALHLPFLEIFPVPSLRIVKNVVQWIKTTRKGDAWDVLPEMWL